MIINIIYLVCIEQQQNLKKIKRLNNQIDQNMLDEIRIRIKKKNEYIVKNEQQNKMNIQAQETKLKKLAKSVDQLLNKFDFKVNTLKFDNQNIENKLIDQTFCGVNKLCLIQNDCINKTEVLSKQLKKNHNDLAQIVKKTKQTDNDNMSNKEIQHLYDQLCDSLQTLRNISSQSQYTTKIIRDNNNQIVHANDQFHIIIERLQPRQIENHH